jgi:FKBP-type peptidyl-prolyl cis-trans isomerase
MQWRWRTIRAWTGTSLVVAGVVMPPLAAEQPAAELPAAQPATQAAAERAAARELDAPAATLGYALGMRIGSRIAADFKGQEPAVDAAALARGLSDAILEAQPRLSDRQIRQALEAFDARMREREKEFGRRMREAAKVNLAKSTEFAAANGRKQGIVTRPSGLQYEVIRAGTGASPTLDDAVAAHYSGTHIDGRTFDATDPKGEPAVFPLRGVVPGWQEALPLMKTGAKWRIYLPPRLAYGEEGSPPDIEPNELLIFEIELLDIVPAK